MVSEMKMGHGVPVALAAVAALGVLLLSCFESFVAQMASLSGPTMITFYVDIFIEGRCTGLVFEMVLF